MFEPQNRLEESLVKATTQPESRAQFYRDFLESELYLLPHGEVPEIKDGALQTGSQVAFQAIAIEGKTWLPVFSSLPRLQAALEDERSYLRMAARNFLELTRGADIMLNPGSEYGKEFVASEIAGLLDGSIFGPESQHVVERDTEVLLGEPARYPQALVEALQRLYPRLPMVKAAWLTQIFNPDRDESAGLLIAIEATGDWDRVVGESGITSRGLTPDHAYLDYIRLDGSTLQAYFRGKKPFYKKSLLGSLFRRGE
ncbi:MAG TPA: enhanced serine sensitivity protein SseB C-terminal domain-containing protein [Thermoanaerobaculia bacterium]|nr:enhanced serine sensitivity protein SseB C-terminal domain-containing protein [Thermoanaerobaculia bacterium]